MKKPIKNKSLGQIAFEAYCCTDCDDVWDLEKYSGTRELWNKVAAIIKRKVIKELKVNKGNYSDYITARDNT